MAETPHGRRGQAVAPEGLVVGSIASVQLGAGLSVTLFDDLGPAGTSLLRLVFAALAVSLVWRPRWSELWAPGVPQLVIVYGLVLGFMNTLFYEALGRIPLGIAVTLEFIGPLAVAVVGSRRRLDLVWVGLAAAGIAMLGLRAFDPDALDPVGVGFALAAGACWAAYIVVAQRLGSRVAGTSALGAGMLVAALVPIGPGVIGGGAMLLKPELLAQGLAIGVLSSAVPYTLEFIALRRMDRRVFGVMMSLEPAAAALVGLVVLGQVLIATDLLAIGFVVVASAGAGWTARAARPPGEP